MFPLQGTPLEAIGSPSTSSDKGTAATSTILFSITSRFLTTSISSKTSLIITTKVPVSMIEHLANLFSSPIYFTIIWKSRSKLKNQKSFILFWEEHFRVIISASESYFTIIWKSRSKLKNQKSFILFWEEHFRVVISASEYDKPWA